ncbi:S41 family peptidase [Gelidibacter salicanalis]|uniref:Peptidase S41 n=1 Tax=Gelidibacter salicanalis TaxID=291193 RepID=A0A934KWA5_9FLAO|nr:S41 family peptidase [Gelidibacter salicanalis]MBJ7881787.1 peptidase S41 [Gelidibacter salicanalis]
MRILKIALLALVVFSVNTSCYDDKDDNIIDTSVIGGVEVNEINDFVWKAMNIFYLYKDEIPNLADNRFSTDEAYAAYINGFNEPEDLFESLIYQREVVDRFSFITSDYVALEQQFAGVFKSNGLEFDFYRQPQDPNAVFGLVRIALNDSPGSIGGVKRGDIFNAINDVPMTVENFASLLRPDTYTLNFANYNTNGTATVDDDKIESNNSEATLTKIEYNENPIHIAKVIEVNGSKIGYLMYNGFIRNYDEQLNNAFGDFKTAGVQHLVLDLRYNGGGSVNTAALLASMITGQFNGQVFSKLVYNKNLQSENTSFNFRNTANEVGGAINSLNLDKIYVLTTNRTASASELIINSLSPYINVVQIGGKTTGKSQASITLYDSPNFSRENANPNHTYAIQPLVAMSINKNDQPVAPTGIESALEQFRVREIVNNLGVLGDVNEPFLARAIADITGSNRPAPSSMERQLVPLKDNVDANILDNEMYIDAELKVKLLEKFQ